LVEKSYSDDVVVDAARKEMARHELAWGGTVVAEGSTFVVEVAMVVDHTWLGHVDRDQKGKQQRQENWTVVYGRRWEGRASPSSALQPLYLEFLK
jgi:hypothetical protein